MIWGIICYIAEIMRPFHLYSTAHPVPPHRNERFGGRGDEKRVELCDVEYSCRGFGSMGFFAYRLCISGLEISQMVNH